MRFGLPTSVVGRAEGIATYTQVKRNCLPWPRRRPSIKAAGGGQDDDDDVEGKFGWWRRLLWCPPAATLDIQNKLRAVLAKANDIKTAKAGLFSTLAPASYSAKLNSNLNCVINTPTACT